jgi:glycosyltransferase involved in cell wall biosynthesis
VRYLYLGGFPKNRALPFGANTKGGETLLQSWQAAEDELAARGASLLVLGCDGHFKRVSAWRARLRSPEKVHLAGFVPPEKVSAYIRSSDAVLVPSIHDGLPNVAVEACACARPVFASNIGGNSEVIVNEETGILLPPGDVAAWKRALITYADRPSCLREMGNRARKRMETLFDCSNFPQGMLNLYEAALREQLHT